MWTRGQNDKLNKAILKTVENDARVHTAVKITTHSQRFLVQYLLLQERRLTWPSCKCYGIWVSFYWIIKINELISYLPLRPNKKHRLWAMSKVDEKIMNLPYKFVIPLLVAIYQHIHYYVFVAIHTGYTPLTHLVRVPLRALAIWTYQLIQRNLNLNPARVISVSTTYAHIISFSANVTHICTFGNTIFHTWALSTKGRQYTFSKKNQFFKQDAQSSGRAARQLSENKTTMQISQGMLGRMWKNR